jgi:hypothetical protein
VGWFKRNFVLSLDFLKLFDWLWDSGIFVGWFKRNFVLNLDLLKFFDWRIDVIGLGFSKRRRQHSRDLQFHVVDQFLIVFEFGNHRATVCHAGAAPG